MKSTDTWLEEIDREPLYLDWRYDSNNLRALIDQVKADALRHAAHEVRTSGWSNENMALRLNAEADRIGKGIQTE